MCSCHSILECCVTFSGVKLSIRSFVLLVHKERKMKDGSVRYTHIKVRRAKECFTHDINGSGYNMYRRISQVLITWQQAAAV